jgi:hypothetical protein
MQVNDDVIVFGSEASHLGDHIGFKGLHGRIERFSLCTLLALPGKKRGTGLIVSVDQKYVLSGLRPDDGQIRRQEGFSGSPFRRV